MNNKTKEMSRTPLFVVPVSPAMLDAACTELPDVPREQVSRALSAAMRAGTFYIEAWGGGGQQGQIFAAGGSGGGGSNQK